MPQVQGAAAGGGVGGGAGQLAQLAREDGRERPGFELDVAAREVAVRACHALKAAASTVPPPLPEPAASVTGRSGIASSARTPNSSSIKPCSNCGAIWLTRWAPQSQSTYRCFDEMIYSRGE